MHIGRTTQTGGAAAAQITAAASSSVTSLELGAGRIPYDRSGRQEISFRHPALLAVRTSKGCEFFIRALDIAGSLMILILSLPLMFAVAVAVKLSSSGRVFYGQRRVGKSGKLFTLYKFRTMIENAEEHVGPVWATPNDSRVTSIGRVLRRTRLDELPQLFNVVLGDMSLVGPRPERPYFVERHEALQGIRLAVKPGITGLAQVRSYYDLKPEHKLKYDYLYIQRRSLLLNAYILLQTIPVLFTKKGW